ncbi:DUF5906 domain-containing protein [Herbaspirillum sp. ST 5-3]|uniref:DUF5906 domain-containing protein n=1 Tax=Oxalobacteraceae TaxID=75682 RepID=UPI0014560283|nr:DUF5906 domain-containing protein [Herbaspirillum sp. ST 5-3]
MTFDASAIPQELKDRPQWLIWRFEVNPKKPDGKKLKVPYYAGGGKRWGVQGDDKDRAKLVTLDVAIAAMVEKGFTGVGFAFLPGDGLIGIDIDKCIDLNTGEISPTADELIQSCLSYTEYSPSGSGVHIIVSGQTDTFKSDKIGLEVFCSSQFFTFTGQPYGGLPLVVTPIAAATLDRMRDLVMKARSSTPPAQSGPHSGPRTRTPFEERARIMSALTAIPPDEYAIWIKVGMALYTSFGESGFSVWDDWSSTSGKYGGASDLETHWKSFKARGVSVTAGAIFGLAKDHNWRPPRQAAERPVPRPKSPAPEREARSPVGAAGDGVAGGPTDPAAADQTPAPESEEVPGGDGPGVPAWVGEGPDHDAEFLDDDGGDGKSKNKRRGAAFWAAVDHLLEHFVLLYGTNTAWDGVNRLQIKITDLRYAYGSDAVKFWLGNGDRRMINFNRLVFDPTRAVDDPTVVNLYNGFAVEPKVAPYDKILDLLLHLCDGNEDLFFWLLRWIAYPLRHPGAKMASSVIMHGDEGSGKNLFWEHVVRSMYGEYGGVITNAEIESQFNEWASMKLLLICDEVVTRNELKQLKGKLKSMISGKEIRINPKNLPGRDEANHVNFIFLSNELQPLALDKTDRRYLVVWTPPKKDADYYRAVAEQAESGGIQGFYNFLMNELDMGDFNPHTKPIDTQAKRNLITLGLSAPERFYLEWKEGLIPLPFVCCSAMQLYQGFQRWCHLNGERFPPSQTIFGGAVERMAAGEVVRKLVKYELGASAAKQRTAYIVAQPPEGKTLSEWVEGGSSLFEKDLKKYRHVYDQVEVE